MTQRALVLSLAVFSILGCKVPEPAPEEVGALTHYLFLHFEDEEQDQMRVGTVELEEYIDTLDLSGNVNDRSVSLPVLEGESLGSLSIPVGIAAEDQEGVAVFGLSRHDFDANLSLAGEPNQVCVESNTTVYYHREFLTEKECFLRQTCERVSTLNEVRKETLVSKLWYDLYKDFRFVELDDGRSVIYARTWIEEVFEGDTGANSLNQSFTIEAWIPDAGAPSSTRRFYAMWSSVTGLGGDIYASMVKSGLDEGMQNADSFLDGVGYDYCPNDRDREYDRE
ncbi:MAG: hypothetical protein JRI25_06440 [Deltaproteobacteria bacterium]|nr:hypothetical protein [Deltaproteobacteria bacterium]